MEMFTLSLYFIVTLFISVFLVVYIWSNGKSTYMRFLGALGFLIAIYVMGYMLELHSKTMDTAILWNGFQYISIPIVSTVWLIVVLLYTGIVKKARSLSIAALFVIPFITYFVRYSNSLYHLYYTSYDFRIVNDFALLTFEKGLWYYVQYIYSLTQLVCIVIIFFYQGYKKQHNRNKYFTLGSIGILNFASMFLMAIDPTGLGLDYSAILLPIPVILFFYLIGGEDYFEISSLARNSLFVNNDNAILIVNNKNMITDFNKKAKDFFTNQDLKLDKMYLSDYESVNKTIYDLLISDEKQLYHIDENDRNTWWEVKTSALYNNRNRKSGVVKTITDVTESQLVQKKLEQYAKTDDLSRLYNRRAFLEFAEEYIQRAADEDLCLTLIMYDIDHFKNVNDNFGHQTGDCVISTLSSYAKQHFRNSDIVARIGGEEFAVLMLGADEKIAFERADSFRKQIEALKMIDADPDYKITLSIGIARYPGSINVSDFLNLADKALYKAKDNGRNKTEINNSGE